MGALSSILSMEGSVERGWRKRHRGGQREEQREGRQRRGQQHG